MEGEKKQGSPRISKIEVVYQTPDKGWPKGVISFMLCVEGENFGIGERGDFVGEAKSEIYFRAWWGYRFVGIGEIKHLDNIAVETKEHVTWPGVYAVRVMNPDGSASDLVEFIIRPQPESKPLENIYKGNIFEKRGYAWKISHKRSDPFFVKDNKGMYYIATLLANPDEYMTALKLVELTDGYTLPLPDVNLPRSAKDAERDWKDELADPFYGTGGGGEIIDKETKEDIRKEVERLTKKGKEVGGLSKNEQRDKEWLEKYLKESTRPGGKIRHFAGETQKERKAVTTAINRALEEIHKEDPEGQAYKHLKNFIRIAGFRYSYAPEEDITWHVCLNSPNPQSK